MKENRNRIIVAIIALIVLVGAIFFVNYKKGNDFDKTIQIKIVDDQGDVLFDEAVETNAGTLADVLKEMKEEDKIKLEYKNSDWGMYITGMGKDKLIQQNEKKQLYWVYDSKNNTSCVEDGFCSAADSLEIADQDEFVFTLTDSVE